MKYILIIFFAVAVSLLSLLSWPLGVMFIAFMGLFFFGISNTAIFMLVIGILLVFQPLLVYFKVPFLQLFDEFLLLFAFICVFFSNLLHRRTFLKTPIDSWVMFLVMIGVLSSLVNRIVPGHITLGGALLFLKSFLFFYVFLNVPWKTKHIGYIVKTFLVIGVMTAFYAFLGAFFPTVFLQPLGISRHAGYFNFPSLQSFMGHPGPFAAFMAIFAVFTFAHYWGTGKQSHLWLNVFFVVCMILSFRRTSFFGYVLATLVILFLPKVWVCKKNTTRKTAIIVLVVLGIIFIQPLTTMYKNVYISYFSGIESPRSILLKTGFQVAKDYFPLGAGFGTFASGINQTFYSPLFYKYQLFTVWGLSTEKSSFINDTFWPHVLAEVGIFGLFCYLIIIGLLLRLSYQAVKEFVKEPIEWRIFALGTFMMLIISLIESTKAVFYEGTLWAYLYFGAAGIIVRHYLYCRKKNQKFVQEKFSCE